MTHHYAVKKILSEYVYQIWKYDDENKNLVFNIIDNVDVIKKYYEIDRFKHIEYKFINIFKKLIYQIDWFLLLIILLLLL